MHVGQICRSSKPLVNWKWHNCFYNILSSVIFNEFMINFLSQSSIVKLCIFFKTLWGCYLQSDVWYKILSVDYSCWILLHTASVLIINCASIAINYPTPLRCPKIADSRNWKSAKLQSLRPRCLKCLKMMVWGFFLLQKKTKLYLVNL